MWVSALIKMISALPKLHILPNAAMTVRWLSVNVGYYFDKDHICASIAAHIAERGNDSQMAASILTALAMNIILLKHCSRSLF